MDQSAMEKSRKFRRMDSGSDGTDTEPKMYGLVYSTDLNIPLPGTATRTYMEANLCRWSDGGFQVGRQGLPHLRVDAFDTSGNCLRSFGLDPSAVGWLCWGGPWPNDFGDAPSEHGPRKHTMSRNDFLQRALQAMITTAPDASIVMLIKEGECSWLIPNRKGKQLIVGSANVGSYCPRNGDAQNPESVRAPTGNVLALMSVAVRHLPFLRYVGGDIDMLFFLWSVSRTENSVIYGSFTGSLEVALTQYGASRDARAS